MISWASVKEVNYSDAVEWGSYYGDWTLGKYGKGLRELCKVVSYISCVELKVKEGEDKLEPLALVFHSLCFWYIGNLFGEMHSYLSQSSGKPKEKRRKDLQGASGLDAAPHQQGELESESARLPTSNPSG